MLIDYPSSKSINPSIQDGLTYLSPVRKGSQFQIKTLSWRGGLPLRKQTLNSSSDIKDRVSPNGTVNHLTLHDTGSQSRSRTQSEDRSHIKPSNLSGSVDKSPKKESFPVLPKFASLSEALIELANTSYTIKLTNDHVNKNYLQTNFMCWYFEVSLQTKKLYPTQSKVVWQQKSPTAGQYPNYELCQQLSKLVISPEAFCQYYSELGSFCITQHQNARSELSRGLLRVCQAIKDKMALSLPQESVTGLYLDCLSDPYIRLCPPLFLTLGLQLARILKIFHANSEMIHLLKLLVDMVKGLSPKPFCIFRLEAYQQLAEAFTSLGKYRTAVCYAKRALEVSFYLNSFSSELKIYDLLGKCYYYLDDSKRSVYFHQRMYESLLEPASAPLRKLMAARYQGRLQKERNLYRATLLADGRINRLPKSMALSISSNGSEDMQMSQLAQPSIFQTKEDEKSMAERNLEYNKLRKLIGPDSLKLLGRHGSTGQLMKSPSPRPLKEFEGVATYFFYTTKGQQTETRTAAYTIADKSKIASVKLLTHMSFNREDRNFFCDPAAILKGNPGMQTLSPNSSKKLRSFNRISSNQQIDTSRGSRDSPDKLDREEGTKLYRPVGKKFFKRMNIMKESYELLKDIAHLLMEVEKTPIVDINPKQNTKTIHLKRLAIITGKPLSISKTTRKSPGPRKAAVQPDLPTYHGSIRESSEGSSKHTLAKSPVVPTINSQRRKTVIFANLPSSPRAGATATKKTVFPAEHTSRIGKLSLLPRHTNTVTETSLHRK